jgi:hypothetical protein
MLARREPHVHARSRAHHGPRGLYDPTWRHGLIIRVLRSVPDSPSRNGFYRDRYCRQAEADARRSMDSTRTARPLSGPTLLPLRIPEAPGPCVFTTVEGHLLRSRSRFRKSQSSEGKSIIGTVHSARHRVR